MPRFSDHLVKSAIRLVRQSTTVPNTSNTSALTAEISGMVAPLAFFVLLVIPGRAKREPGIHNHDREYGFGDAQLRICGLRQAAHPGMTVARLSSCIA